MNRKMIKITIPEKMVETFNIAKKITEAETNIKMSDIQYASRVFQWAIEKKAEGK